jgi:hypothetical protein
MRVLSYVLALDRTDPIFAQVGAVESDRPILLYVGDIDRGVSLSMSQEKAQEIARALGDAVRRANAERKGVASE